MTTVLCAVCAVIPAFMAFACYLSDLPAFAGAGLMAAFLLAMCVWGHVWVPAVVCAAWVAGAVWRLVVALKRPRSKPAVWPVPRREHERILRAHRTELGVLWAALPDERLHAACYDPLPGDKKVA